MRVKVGGTWYEAKAGEPLMVELAAADRANIAAMDPDADRYAAFADEDAMTREERHAWMDAGARPSVRDALLAEIERVSAKRGRYQAYVGVGIVEHPIALMGEDLVRARESLLGDDVTVCMQALERLRRYDGENWRG